MAIEDGYQLAVDLSEAAQRAETSGTRVHVEELLKVCRRPARPVTVYLSCPLPRSPAKGPLSQVLQWLGGPDADVLLAQIYARKRIARTGTIHGLAGMAAIAASTYKAYLGEGLGPLSFIKQLRIPHPGRVRSVVPTLLSSSAGPACCYNSRFLHEDGLTVQCGQEVQLQCLWLCRWEATLR